MIKELRRYVLPQINIYESHHKIEIPVRIPADSNLLKDMVDYNTGKPFKKLFAGTIYPSNDINAQGIIVNDYFSYNGEDINASICVHGVVANWRLPEKAVPNAKIAMKLIEVRDHAFVLKPELLCKIDQFREGTKKIITAVILLSAGEFLPGVELKNNWTLSGTDGAEIEHISCKSRNLITININVEKTTFNDRYPENNYIKLKLNSECTTYKQQLDEITVGELVGEYHIPRIYCENPLDFVWGTLDGGQINLKVENANFLPPAGTEAGWLTFCTESDFIEVVKPDSVALQDNRVTIKYTFKDKKVTFNSNVSIVTVKPNPGAVDIDESAFEATQIIRLRKE